MVSASSYRSDRPTSRTGSCSNSGTRGFDGWRDRQRPSSWAERAACYRGSNPCLPANYLVLGLQLPIAAVGRLQNVSTIGLGHSRFQRPNGIDQRGRVRRARFDSCASSACAWRSARRPPTCCASSFAKASRSPSSDSRLVLGLAVLLGWGLRAAIYQIAPLDPVALGAATGILAIAWLAASIIPARRAANVLPMTALRQG